MKITLSLNQVNELVKLSRAEQHAVVNHLNELAKMSEEEIIDQKINDELPTLADEVQRLTRIRIKAARRQRERKQRQQAQSITAPVKRPQLKGALQHEIKAFERNFKDGYQTLVSQHLRALKKILKNIAVR